MTFTIQVTQKHIQEGKRKSISSCPIALALKRERFEDVMVETTYCSFWIGNLSYGYFFPKSAQTFIEKFDAGKKVRPFNFKVKI